MGYDTIRNGIINRIQAKGLTLCSKVSTYDGVSSHEFGHTFILRVLDGELLDDGSDTLATHYYDYQTWEIQIAVERSEQNEAVNMDELQRMREDLQEDLANPTNFSSFARNIRIKRWKMDETDAYFVIKIDLNITDKIIFT
jgi:hypothetical protein